MKPKKVLTRSPLWDLFTKVDESYAECNTCKCRKRWRSVGGFQCLGALYRHYFNEHPNKNQNLVGLVAEDKADAVDCAETAKSKPQPRLSMPNPQKGSTEDVLMASKNASKKRKAMSPVWEFFTKLDGRSSECNICKVRMFWKTASGHSMVGNLVKHYYTKHSNKNQSNGADLNEASEEYEGDYEDQEIPPLERPLKKQKIARSTLSKSVKKNYFSLTKRPKGGVMRPKLGLKLGFGTSKSKKVAFSSSSKRTELMNAKTKSRQCDLEGVDKNESVAFESKVELKKLTVQDLIQAKVKPKVIEDYFGNVKLPAKPSSKASKRRVVKAKATPYDSDTTPVNADPPVPMIGWKNNDSPNLLNTYNNIKTQGDMIEAMIKDALPNLQCDKVSEIYNFLVDLGVENVEDLAYLEVDDMNKVLKPIQSRKLLAIWKNKGFHNQTIVPDPATIQNYENKVDHIHQSSESSPQSEIVPKMKIPVSKRKNNADPSPHDVYPGYASEPKLKAEPAENATPLPLPAPEDWTDTFEIPWRKLPPGVMKCLSKKKRPNRTERFQIIHTVADDIFEISKYPTLSQVERITEEMMQKYPQSLCDEESSGECQKWVNQLQTRIKYLRKIDGKESADLSKDGESPQPNSTAKLNSTLSGVICAKSKSSEPLNTSVVQRTYLTTSGSALGTTSASGEFQIPWHKMPQNIMDTLNKNEPLTKEKKDILVAIVIDHYVVWNPKKENVARTVREIADRMCEIYPLSLSNKAFGVKGGGQYSSSALYEFLYRRNFNVRRHRKRRHPFSASTFCKVKNPLNNSDKSLQDSRETPLKHSDSQSLSSTTCTETNPSGNSDKSLHTSIQTPAKQSDSQCLSAYDHTSPTKSNKSLHTSIQTPAKQSDYQCLSAYDHTSPTKSNKSLHTSIQTPAKRSDYQCLSVDDRASPTKSPRGEFTIRWHNLDRTLLDALDRSQQLTPAQSSNLVLAVSEEVLRRNPGAFTITKIAERLCEKYPASLSNAALGFEDDGNPASALSGMLKLKLCDLRQARKRKVEEASDMDIDSSLTSADVPRSTEEEKSSPMKFDFGEFCIPWHKLDPSVLDSLNLGKRIAKEDKRTLVYVICEEFWESKPKGVNIRPYQCSNVLAKRLVQLYPKSFSNPALGKKGAADSFSCLSDSFRSKITQLKKDSGKLKSKLKAKGIQPTVESHQCFCDDCPFRSFDWAFNFKIPFAKMPQELQESLEKKERLSPTLRSELVLIISRDILKLEESPNKECVDYIAEKLCSTYPKSLCDVSSNDIGNRHEILGREILFKIHYINNNDISVEEESKEKKNVDSQENSMQVDDELVKNIPISEVALDADLKDSLNPKSCISSKDPVYNLSSGVLELSPSTNDNKSSTGQDSNNCTNSSVKNTSDLTSSKSEERLVPNDNSESGICSENVVPNDNMKSDINSDEDAKSEPCDATAKAFIAKDGADCIVEPVTDPIKLVLDNVTKSTMHRDVCGIKSGAISAIAVPICILQSVEDATKLVLDGDLYPDIIKCCDIKCEAIAAEEAVHCCEKAVMDMTKLVKDDNAESVTDSTKLVSNNSTESVTDLTVGLNNNVGGVKSPDTMENRAIIIKSAVSMKGNNLSSNAMNDTGNEAPNGSTNSVEDTSVAAPNFGTPAAKTTASNNSNTEAGVYRSNVALNYNITSVINTASDNFSKQFGTYQSNVVSVCGSKSVTFQTEAVPDCNALNVPSNMKSNYNPSPLAYPVNMVPNCTPPMNAAVQPNQMQKCSPNMITAVQPYPVQNCSPNMNTAVQPYPMQNCSPKMNTAVQPYPMQNCSPNMNKAIQPNPIQHYSPNTYPHAMACQPVMVPNYNANPVTCWPPPVMAPNYNSQPMAYPSNVAQNCNDLIYVGSFSPNCGGANQIAYPVSMNQMVNYSGVNTGTYQPSSGSGFNHGYNVPPVQYFQNIGEIVKTEELEPDQKNKQS